MKPILFNTEMVRAILEGRKTVTRRVVKPRYKDRDAGFWVQKKVTTGEITGIEIYDEEECGTERYVKPPYQAGDILYVRETWREYNGKYYYRADECPDYDNYKTNPKWKPSIHMPKEAARIFLRVADVRVERLQDITPKQAGNEGVSWETDNSGQFRRWQFHKLWDSTINKKDLDEYGWNANPWVWVIEFERFEKGGENVQE